MRGIIAVGTLVLFLFSFAQNVLGQDSYLGDPTESPEIAEAGYPPIGDGDESNGAYGMPPTTSEPPSAETNTDRYNQKNTDNEGSEEGDEDSNEHSDKKD